MRRAFVRPSVGLTLFIHAAVLKQVPDCECNPFEAIKTNVLGAQNIIRAEIDKRVKRVIALSTDMVTNPIKLYGAIKLCSNKLFVAGNSMSGEALTRFSVVRYGNVLGSRRSVVPLFLSKQNEGVPPITDDQMTRFWISLQDAVDFVIESLTRLHSGEILCLRFRAARSLNLQRPLPSNFGRK